MATLQDLGNCSDSQSEGFNHESNSALVPSQKSSILTSNPSPASSRLLNGSPAHQNDSTAKTKIMKSIACSNIDSLKASLELLLDGYVQGKLERETIQSTMVQLEKLDFLKTPEDNQEGPLILAASGTKTSLPPTHVKVGKFKVIRPKWAEAYACVQAGDIKKASIILFEVFFSVMEKRTCTLKGRVRSPNGTMTDSPKLDTKRVEAIIRSIASMKKAIAEERTNIYYFNKDDFDKEKANADIKLTRQAIIQKLNENRQAFRRAARRGPNDAP